MIEKKFQIRTAGFVFFDKKLLLIKHRKNNREYWVVPGGRVEFGEKSVDTLKREFMEELNIQIEPVKFLFFNESLPPEYPYHNLNLFFLVKHLSSEIKLGDEPILAGYNLFSKKDIPNIELYPQINNIICENFDLWLKETK